jgi:hypothetical protein
VIENGGSRKPRFLISEMEKARDGLFHRFHRKINESGNRIFWFREGNTHGGAFADAK